MKPTVLITCTALSLAGTDPRSGHPRFATRKTRYPGVLGLATALLTLAGAGQVIAGDYSLDFLIAPYHPGIVDS